LTARCFVWRPAFLGVADFFLPFTREYQAVPLSAIRFAEVKLAEQSFHVFITLHLDAARTGSDTVQFNVVYPHGFLVMFRSLGVRVEGAELVDRTTLRGFWNLYAGFICLLGVTAVAVGAFVVLNVLAPGQTVRNLYLAGLIPPFLGVFLMIWFFLRPRRRKPP